MKNNKLLIYGAVAVGAIVLYSRYSKTPTQQEEQGGGSAGGGGGFGPVGPLPIIPVTPNVVVVNPPSRGGIKPITMTNPIVLSGLGGAKPVVSAPSSSTSAGAQSGVGVSNTGGIVPISQGGSPTPTYSTGTVTQSQMSTGLSGGAVFKPFDGDNGRLRLENLVRSFNRP